MTAKVDIRALRLNRGLRLREAASKMGINHQVLLRAEKGSTPQPPNAFAIARFYGMQVTDIWPLDEPASAAA